MQQREPARKFEDLIVWQKAHHLALRMCALTDAFPSRTFKLVSQIEEAAASVPANIAEGFKRRGKLDKARFINFAQGSLAEAWSRLILARDRGYARIDDLTSSVEEVGRLLEAYLAAILRSARKE